MNNKDNLQESFKKAFENHNEPLLNHQWVRLNLDLKNQKKKSIFSFWNISIALGLIFLGTLIGFYLKPNKIESQISKTTTTEQQTNSELLSKNPKKQFENQNVEQYNQNNTQITENKATVSTEKEEMITKKLTTPKPSRVLKENFNKNSFSNPKNNESLVNNNLNNQNKGLDLNKLDALTDINNEEPENQSNSKVEEKTNTSEQDQKEIVNKTEEEKEKDSLPKVVSNIKPLPKATIMRNKMAVFVSYGFSSVKTAKTSINNDANLHKDGFDLFKQSEKGKESRLFNIGIEFYIKKNLNLVLQTGTQYREVINKETIDYQYNQIPFRDVDGGIIGYFNDTFNPMRIVSSNVLKRRYVTIPIQFAYIFPIHPKHELQPSFGLNINKLVSASGNIFSVNDGVTKPLSSVLSKKINIGMMAGIQYNYNIRNRWWLGASTQWQQNIQNNDLSYNSSVKSKINQYNYNLILKYKF